MPESALLRGSDGDWLIYSTQDNTRVAPVHIEEAAHEHGSNDSDEHNQAVEVVHDHENEQGAHQLSQGTDSKQTTFVAQEVELGAVFRVFSPKTKQWLSWREIKGAAANSHFAITGAFFIASQGAKSGFDAHNH